MSNLEWSTGYVKSIRHSKQGTFLQTSKLIHSWKFGNYTIPLRGNAIATLGCDNILGGGLSIDCKNLITLGSYAMSPGVSYLAGGYKWSGFLNFSKR
ncbi:MAG: hypothetical protein ABFD54_05960 [Armatimonadota bacterium]